MRRASAAVVSAAFTATVLSTALASAQAVVGGDFTLTERSDFSRYIDGRYLGHVYRESRGSLRPAGAVGVSASEVGGPSSDGAASMDVGERAYEGEFFVLEETLRDARDAARRVDRSALVRLSVARGGAISVQEDSGFPSLRGLPSMPEASFGSGLKLGDTWTAEGTRALDFEAGSFVLIPFLAEYRFLGRTAYRGRPALNLSAKFATRWKATTGKLLGAGGTHDLDILIDAETLSPLFIRDRFDETFSLAAVAGGGTGSSERRSGFSLYFFEGAVPLDLRATGQAIAAAVDSAVAGLAPTVAPQTAASTGSSTSTAADDGSPSGAGPGELDAGEKLTLADDGGLGAASIELASSPEGLVLRVKDLRFVADSDAILDSELWRLDAIAAALKALPGRSFLVAGHSAAVGKAAGELELSVKRAKRVADELTARGIAASHLLYRGFGSSQPLASNDTEEGRARNRRVEITIVL